MYHPTGRIVKRPVLYMPEMNHLVPKRRSPTNSSNPQSNAPTHWALRPPGTGPPSSTKTSSTPKADVDSLNQKLPGAWDRRPERATGLLGHGKGLVDSWRVKLRWINWGGFHLSRRVVGC